MLRYMLVTHSLGLSSAESFPPAVLAGARHLLSLDPEQDAETDVSVRAERARLAGNEWQFDYAALHSPTNTIKGSKAGLGGRSPLSAPFFLPAADRGFSFPSSPAWTKGLPTFCPRT